MLFIPRKKYELLFLVLAALFAASLSEALNLKFLPTILLFFAVPAIFLSLRGRAYIARSLAFTLTMLVPLTIFDYLAYLDYSWFVPGSMWRILRGGVAIETLVLNALWVYLVVMFWKYFCEPSLPGKFTEAVKYLLLFIVAGAAGFILIFSMNRLLLYVPYFYLALGLVFGVVPLIVFLLLYPKLVWRLLFLAGYFWVFLVIHEWVGLRHGQWFFGGSHYLGVVSFFGRRLPLEEILFWWGTSSPATVAWYKLFME
ncbi:MAG: hypothetical protein UV61_C0015G0016 [Candidatus Gottesmanbacteria bacterium GW2011_GWB1_43_11]|uniref:Uncharacterized protein n=1 Tax=Candidatus Gottesmanbacteria bacterium GW2011_GWB1_43_11 TaxID=1618446 RepID=A0A0G1CJY6_9BACT|nr:MAG: hypothetical protein UV04_C0036G0009 [Candidatus Gottesmanbacteria bacterium GW2011_GWA2_42_16]KKS53704.1 MAG: hypothetical protein UV17_C0032G0004 [Candidatus Gottesmanbacteria bacterium GW2011_GWA1_42_26]KKS81105.1 MAG: hypothetical protein UV55_C0021G0006 [Candidatus Gottesmanbacteria bacterium GW2011_GWC1_43_10]KKS85802.1 MAG: hypothetical protein UV61_C0015G0016 [Candidatus Gottesmanbacteria bacterium GW2011_GWB1_43_11]OGG09988.1 MAG: hypothetical protein A2699_04145 [Candidatus Go